MIIKTTRFDRNVAVQLREPGVSLLYEDTDLAVQETAVELLMQSSQPSIHSAQTDDSYYFELGTELFLLYDVF